MNALFPKIRLPSFKDITDIKVQALQENLPTLDVDLDAIRKGADPSEVASSIQNGANDAKVRVRRCLRGDAN
jgi:hypothetical protein